jgi:hypothetical protein
MKEIVYCGGNHSGKSTVPVPCANYIQCGQFAFVLACWFEQFDDANDMMTSLPICIDCDRDDQHGD